MKHASDFRVGDPVFEHGIMCAGEIEMVFTSHVVVRWEDGKTGVLDEDPHCLCTLQNLMIAKKVSAP